MEKKALPKQTLLTRSLSVLVAVSGVLVCLSGTVLVLHGHMAAVMPTLAPVTLGQIAFPFILLPASMMAGLWHALHAHKAKLLVRFFAVASVAYIAAVMAATVWWQAHLMSDLLFKEEATFVGMFVVTASLIPWALFALRDRGNQLFIVMLWAMTVGCLLLLPLFLAMGIGPFMYAVLVWLVMILILFVENVRQTARARELERARMRAEAAAMPAKPAPEEG